MRRLPTAVEWEAALYGPDGFYRRPEGPAGHFSTATHGAPGAVLGAALARLARDHGLTRVVDVGAGRGELLTHVANADPGLALLGVDVVARPEGLAAQADWLLSPGGASLPRGLTGLADTLVVAHEWLDVVPCTIARRPKLGRADREWADHWWPDDPTEDDVVEVGRARDEAWADLLSRLDHGVAVAIDYGHTRASRPPAPTFTAFRDGIEVEPALDGTTDLTAHVAMDSLRHDDLLTQREALLRLGVSAELPDHALATRDPATYVRALGRANAAAQLVRPDGFGTFLWAVARIGIARVAP